METRCYLTCVKNQVIEGWFFKKKVTLPLTVGKKYAAIMKTTYCGSSFNPIAISTFWVVADNGPVQGYMADSGIFEVVYV